MGAIPSFVYVLIRQQVLTCFDPACPFDFDSGPILKLTNIRTGGRITRMGRTERPTCPGCGAFLILALPPGGEGRRTWQCIDCDRPDPLKADAVMGWLKSELQPPN